MGKLGEERERQATARGGNRVKKAEETSDEHKDAAEEETDRPKDLFSVLPGLGY